MISRLRQRFIDCLYAVTSWAHSAAETNDGQQILRIYLRRWPWWCRGHQLLAESALASGQILTAYASSHAVKQLARTHAERRAARRIDAICLVRSGRYGEAEHFLRALLAENVGDVRVAEELAACLLARGAKGEAAELLGRFCVEELSAEARMARSYASQSHAEEGGDEPR